MRSSRRHARFVLVVLGLVVATLVAAGLALADARDDAREQNAHRADHAASVVARAVGSATDALGSVRRLISSRGDVSGAEFSAFAQGLLGRGGLPAVGFVAAPSGPDRAARLPVTFRSGASAAGIGPVGADLAAAPGVREAFLAARDLGVARATAPLPLLPGGRLVVLVFEPVYAGGAAASPSARRAALIGAAVGSIPTPRLEADVAGHLSGGTRLAVTDGRVPLIGSVPAVGDAIERRLTVGGRTWVIAARGPGVAWAWAMTVLVAGGLLSALVGAMLLQSARRERYAMRLVDERLRGQRAAEAALREREARLRAVIDSSSEAIVMADAAGTIVAWNPGAAAMFGHSERRALGMPVARLLPERLRPSIAPGAADRRALAAMLGRTTELTGLRADGSEFPLELSLSSWVAPGGRVFSGIVRDASERAALERMKDEFVALASHELKTPLTAVLGYLGAVLDGDAGPISDDQGRFLGVAERNARRLVALADDLLMVSRSDAGRLTLQLEPVDLAGLARECAESARPAAGERGLSLAVEVDDAAPPVLPGDRNRLAQVLDNLVSNALKFTPDGGSVRIRAGRDGDEAVLEVRDTGIGMTPDEQERLFERFYRTERARAVAGTGLGLAVAQMIVRAHGGEIGVESVAGAGTTFRVRLPLAGPESAESADRTGEPLCYRRRVLSAHGEVHRPHVGDPAAALPRHLHRPDLPGGDPSPAEAAP